MNVFPQPTSLNIYTPCGAGSVKCRLDRSPAPLLLLLGVTGAATEKRRELKPKKDARSPSNPVLSLPTSLENLPWPKGCRSCGRPSLELWEDWWRVCGELLVEPLEVGKRSELRRVFAQFAGGDAALVGREWTSPAREERPEEKSPRRPASGSRGG